MNYPAIYQELMRAPSTGKLDDFYRWLVGHHQDGNCTWDTFNVLDKFFSEIPDYAPEDWLEAHSSACEFLAQELCEHDSIACMIGAYRTTAARKGERYWASIGCVYGPITPDAGDRCLDCGRKYDGREWVW